MISSWQLLFPWHNKYTTVYTTLIKNLKFCYFNLFVKNVFQLFSIFPFTFNVAIQHYTCIVHTIEHCHWFGFRYFGPGEVVDRVDSFVFLKSYAKREIVRNRPLSWNANFAKQAVFFCEIRNSFRKKFSRILSERNSSVNPSCGPHA